MTDDSLDTIDPGPSGFDFGGDPFATDHIHRLVSSIRNDIAELATFRLCSDTAHLVAAEEASLGSALTALQMLLSHVTAGRPMLRVVK
jgi:hypothetical protein